MFIEPGVQDSLYINKFLLAPSPSMIIKSDHNHINLSAFSKPVFKLMEVSSLHELQTTARNML